MARCPDARALLPAYVEGELGAVETRGVAGHLALCADCRAEEARYRRALAHLAAPREMPRPGDLYAGFAARLAHREAQAAASLRRLRYAGAAACLVLVVGAGAAIVRRALVRPAPVTVAAVTTNPTPAPSVTEPRRPPTDPQPLVARRPNTVQQEPAVFNVEVPAGPSDGAHHRPVPRPRRLADIGARSRGPVTGASAADMAAFYRVRPREGLSVAERLGMDNPPRGAGSVAGPTREPEIVRPLRGVVPGQPERNRVAAIVPEIDQHVDVDGRITRVRTAAGYDQLGRRVLVRVSIGADRADGAVGGPSTRPD